MITVILHAAVDALLVIGLCAAALAGAWSIGMGGGK
jgi:hypothetical protein